MRAKWPILLLGVGLLVGMGLMLFVDQPLAGWLHAEGVHAALRAKGSLLRALSEGLKQPGEWYIALVAAIAITFFHPLRWRGGVLLALSVLASTSNALVKWVSGRERPFRDGQFVGDALTFNPFRGGAMGLFEQSNLSLPSGHACAAFALATALALLLPRWGWLFLLAATATAAERVLTLSHYPSDVVFGAVLGSGGSLLVFHLLRPRLGPELPLAAP
jgi:membrane-associated phospholipid phosphatase